MRESVERYFQSYGGPLDKVISLKYLGQVLTAVEDDCPEVVGNLKNLQRVRHGGKGSWESRGQT